MGSKTAAHRTGGTGMLPQAGMEIKMSVKLNRAWSIAATNGVFCGTATRAHIWANIEASVPSDVLWSMTSKQIAALICAANKSYHDAKSRAGASIEDDCVWVGGRINKLIPLHVLDRMGQVSGFVDVPNRHYGRIANGSDYHLHGLKPGQKDERETVRERQTYWVVTGSDNKTVRIKD